MHVCACMHLYVSRYMCGVMHESMHMLYICVYACVCMCASQRLTWNVFLDSSLQGLSLGELSDVASPADLTLDHQPPPLEVNSYLALTSIQTPQTHLTLAYLQTPVTARV